MRRICWFSCGAASAVATKLSLIGETVIAYCDTGSEHPDNARFMAQCAFAWFGQPIQILRSSKFEDTWAVWEGRRYLAGVDGAPCTRELKVLPRLRFERPSDSHVFGYTADAADVARAKRLRASAPDMVIETPLIDRGITKAGCLAMLANAGIAPPLTYALGFPNANCLPCPKATSPAYWALVRQHFPEKFDRMAKLARDLGVRLTRINGERAFIDDIPADHPTTDAIAPACDFLCSLAEQDLGAIHGATTGQRREG